MSAKDKARKTGASARHAAETDGEVPDLIAGRVAATRTAIGSAVAQWQNEQDLKLKSVMETLGAAISALSVRIDQLERAPAKAGTGGVGGSFRTFAVDNAAAERVAPPAARDATAAGDGLRSFLTQGGSLRDWFAKKGVEIVDKRASGGSLWVLGEASAVRPLLKEAASMKIRFTFSPGGAKSTGGRAGWFTKSLR